jgi:aryl-alcohol dehydrogenase-like predicted oxidoreductase
MELSSAIKGRRTSSAASFRSGFQSANRKRFPWKASPPDTRPMQVRSFGSTDLRVSEFGLGCARIGGIFQGNAGGFVNLVRAAYDGGITFFDTADMYSQGESETILGKAFRTDRHRVVIASKAGYVLPAQRRLIARIKPLVRPLIRLLKLRRSALPSMVRGAPTQNFSSGYLREAVEASLRRLRTDYLDLYQLHSPSVEAVERAEWLPALEDLKRAGKIRHWGISVDTIEAGRAALKFPGIGSLQLVVSLLEPGYAEALLPLARDKGVGVIARECLANGLLIKDEKEIDLQAAFPDAEDRARRGGQLVEHRRSATARGIPLCTLALEYASRRPGVSVSLVGTKSEDQLRALLRQLPAS